jgi:Xaa-Pro aminopeptidase
MESIFERCGAVVVTTPSDLFYFSRFANEDAAIVLTPEAKYYITDKRQTEEAACAIKDFIVMDSGSAGYLECAAELLKELKPESVGFEEDNILYRDYLTLAQLPYRLVGVSEAIHKLRAQKSDDEIARIKSAQQITDEAFAYILGEVREGMSEKELQSRLDAFMIARGASLAFDTIAAFGENTSKPHAHPGERRLHAGDPVILDFGAKIKGYCSDMTRSFFFGKPKDEHVRIYRLVAEAQQRALDNLKAGMTGTEGDALARNVFVQAGLAQYFTHSSGHSLGIDIHELPKLSSRYPERIPSGAVMSVEPGLYFPGEFGIRLEDIVVFENNGIYNLTKSQKKLIIL